MRAVAAKTGGSIEFFSIDKADEALKGADALYTDVWVSMGEEAKFEERISQLEAYRVTMDFMKRTGNPDAIFLHCLPAFHDLETEVGKDIQKKHGIAEMEVTDEALPQPAFGGLRRGGEQAAYYKSGDGGDDWRPLR
jgi:ornithine carbamoyltransferase